MDAADHSVSYHSSTHRAWRIELREHVNQEEGVPILTHPHLMSFRTPHLSPRAPHAVRLEVQSIEDVRHGDT